MNVFKWCLWCLMWPLAAQAQNYPQRPIKLVVAYQAGVPPMPLPASWRKSSQASWASRW